MNQDKIRKCEAVFQTGAHLVIPAKEYEKQAFEFIKEFRDYGSEIDGTGGLCSYENYDEWLKKLTADLDYDHIPDGKVPANTYFYISNKDNRIIGMMNIRHRLNDFLLKEAGHIGYCIRPTQRNKGYATALLKEGLKRCRELDIERVLVTCDKVNIASAKVIQNNGGIMENEFFSNVFHAIVQRYWINL